MADRTELIDKLIEHEGSRRFAYTDSLGFLTIGVGRCIDQKRGKGINMEEQMYLLKNDIDECHKELSQNLVYQSLDTVRQEVLIEMCFNLGYSGLMGFKNMLAALARKEFEKAAKEARSSKWATQIGKVRLNDLMKRLETGRYA